MPLLPTVAQVCGIISCFQSAASLFTAVNSRKEAARRHKEGQAEKAEAKAAEKASKALILGKSDVQYEYDRNFARMGPQFAEGDQTGCMQLMSEMLQMQQQVIAVLHSALTGGHLDLHRLASATDARTDNTISILNNQYQRMATSARIPRSFSSSSASSSRHEDSRRRPPPPPPAMRRPRLCREAQRLLLHPSSSPRYKPTRLLIEPSRNGRGGGGGGGGGGRGERTSTRFFGRECPSCSTIWNDRPVGLLKDPTSKLRYPSDFQFRCHTPPTKSKREGEEEEEELYLCYLCGPERESPVLEGYAGLMEHLRTHSQSELLRPGRVDWEGEFVEGGERRGWIGEEWKGGWVEERSVPSSPRGGFGNVGWMEEGRGSSGSSRVSSGTGGSGMSSAASSSSSSVSSRGSLGNGGYGGNNWMPSPPPRRGNGTQRGYVESRSISSSPESLRRRSYTGSHAPTPSNCGSLGNGGVVQNGSETISPTASLWGGEYVKLKETTDPSSSQTGRRCVCGDG